MTEQHRNASHDLPVDAAHLVRIVVSADAYAFARRNADEHVPNETGGVVIGHAHGSTLVVTRLTGPGPNALHRPDWFVRDGTYAQAMLDAAVAETDGRDNYLGEWHSHPIPQGPSPQDWASMHRISLNGDYDAPHPLLILLRRYRRDWRLEGYRWDGTRLVSAQRVEWQ